MALNDGFKYLRILTNLVLLIFIFIILSGSKYIPAGINLKTLYQLFTVFSDQKSQDIQTSQESSIYPLITNEFNISRNKRKIVVLLLLESLGVPSDPIHADKIKKLYEKNLKDIIKSSNRKEIYFKSFPFQHSPGGTLRMELLTLCNSYNYSDLNMYHKCIPNIIANSNLWFSSYYHSPGLDFYNRRKIFKDVGFDNLFSLREQSINDKNIVSQLKWCLTRNFCAPPDSHLYENILITLKANSNPNLFLNVLTVDAHGPYRDINFFTNNNEFDIYLSMVEKSLSDATDFIKRLLFIKQSYEVSIFLVSDHPALLSSSSHIKDSSSNYFYYLKAK
tara:strand:+ start:2741 stop:3742 length:1002 start_codon:yes stop_codon:yes gene_type:complete